MTKGAKVWLWIALAICILTTAMNATEGRMVSVGIAVVSLLGLVVLLFKEKKFGFYVMCICNAVSCIYSIVTSMSQMSLGGINIFVYIIMSIIGSMMIPGITYLFLRKNFHNLK